MPGARITSGERFTESELLGIPAKVIVGNQYRETGQVEVEFQDGGSRQFLPEDVPAAINRFAVRSVCTTRTDRAQ